jgi:hypothetical protein
LTSLGDDNLELLIPNPDHLTLLTSAITDHQHRKYPSRTRRGEAERIRKRVEEWKKNNEEECAERLILWERGERLTHKEGRFHELRQLRRSENMERGNEERGKKEEEEDASLNGGESGGGKFGGRHGDDDGETPNVRDEEEEDGGTARESLLQ